MMSVKAFDIVTYKNTCSMKTNKYNKVCQCFMDQLVLDCSVDVKHLITIRKKMCDL